VSLFSRIYRFFAPRRRLLYGLTLGLLLGGAIALGSVHVTEDIGAMLPDDGSAAATDFHLLQQAPFVSRIVIQLQGEAGSELTAAAGGDLIELRAATQLGDAPLGLDEPILLEAMQRGIQRALIHAQCLARDLLDPMGYRPPVHGLALQRSEDEEIEGAL